MGKKTKKVKCWIVECRKWGTTKWYNCGPYRSPRKSDLGSLAQLKRSTKSADVRFKKTKCYKSQLSWK